MKSRHGPAPLVRPGRCDGDDDYRTRADGSQLRTARDAAVGAVSHARALHGSSLTFNLAGIFGASLAPYIATWLAQNYGLEYVGYYLSGAAALTIAGLLTIRETKDQPL